MKKSLVFILILALFISPLISAVDVEMKTDFDQGETLLAKVSGNFLEPIIKENIYFYRRHMRTSLTPEVVEINNEFYIYAPLIKKDEVVPGNYSIVIKNTQYMKGVEISEEDIIQNFTITNETADFSIDQGFVVTSESNFFIEVQNLQESSITISKQDVTEGTDSITLLSGEIKEIEFEIGGMEAETISSVELSTENLVYEIPVYLTKEIKSTQKEKSFNLEPSEFNITISTNSNTTRIMYISNTGEEILRDISLSISDSLKSYINLSINEISKIEINSSVQIELFILSQETKTIIGEINAETSGDLSDSSEIYLNFIEDYVPSEEEEIYATKTCNELEGMVCEENEECEGTEVNAKDSVCCLGVCEEVQESSIGMIIGWGIIILVVGFLVWFFLKKYKKAKKPVNLLKIAKGKRPNTHKIPSKYKEMKKPVIKRTFSPPIKTIQPPIKQSKTKPEIKIVEKIVEKPVIKEVEKIIEKPVFKEIEKKVFVARPKRKAPVRYKYKGSELSKTYHKTSCRLARLIKAKHKITNNSQEYFKRRGYKACKVCLGKKK